ncbi:hypothetical protein NMY22_g17654 [Coprinellus aureogranulatus]|nr:hypothetical protein NMY22_g17654 [Coprinellus aureogranulatus]
MAIIQHPASQMQTDTHQATGTCCLACGINIANAEVQAEQLAATHHQPEGTQRERLGNSEITNWKVPKLDYLSELLHQAALPVTHPYARQCLPEHSSPKQGKERIMKCEPPPSSCSGRTQTHYHGAVVYHIEHAENVNTGAVYGTLNQSVVHALDYRILDSLPKHPDVSGRRSEYLENSRNEEMSCVHTWTQTSPDLVLSIHAAAGMGKSTFAHRLGEELRSKDRLAAALFLGVVPPDWGPDTIVRLIAGELGRIHPKAIPSIADAVEQFSGSSVTPQQLFDNFIRRPIQSLDLPHSLHVIMDAIDEWKSHDTFLTQLAALEPFCHLVQFIVLGRVRLQVDDFPRISISFYPLPPASKGVLIKFFQERFSKIRWSHSERPVVGQVDGLAEKAHGVFVWAHTACNLLGSKFRKVPRKRILEELLQSTRKVGDSGLLAELYHGAIVRAFPDDEEREYLRIYLQAIFVLQEPLPIADFAGLFGMEEETVQCIREGLAALQTCEPPNSEGVIYPAFSTFHLSVAEYFQSRSTPDNLAFRISTFDAHAMVAEACLAVLPNLYTSSRNAEIQGLRSMRKYVMEQWPIHTTHGTSSVEPGPAVAWEEVPLLVSLNEAPFNSLLGWGDDLLQSFNIEGARVLSRSRDLDVADLMVSLGIAIQNVDVDAKVHVACLEIAVRLRPDTGLYWSHLGSAYGLPAAASYTPDLCQKAVATHRHAVQLAATDLEEDQAAMKESLACAIHLKLAVSRYMGLAADMDGVQECISLLEEVLRCRSEGHPDRIRSLNVLTSCLSERFKVTKDPEVLEEMIKLDRLALKLCPEGDPQRSRPLNSLASSLSRRFDVTNSLDDLEEAIQLYREALIFLPEAHPDRPHLLGDIAWSLSLRFDVTGALMDLEEAIKLNQEALELHPQGHPDRDQSLTYLACALRQRFGVTGALADLDEAIALDREALGLHPQGHPGHIQPLNSLVSSLCERYKVTGELNNLSDAIQRAREALELRPEGHPHRSRSLSHLALALRNRFEVTKALEDLEEAVELQREILSLRPEGHPDRSMSLFGLAYSLHDVFKISYAPKPLDESIQFHREALGLRPEGHPDRYDSVMNLWAGLSSRFERQETLEDLREMIALSDQALALCGEEDGGRCEWMLEAASAYRKELGAWHAGEECTMLAEGG